MLLRLTNLHGANLIHRQLQPRNFMTGPHGDPRTIYLVDFALAKTYLKRSGKFKGYHIDYLKGKEFKGSPRYASVN